MPRRIIQLPEIGKGLPDKMPFEDRVSGALNKVLNLTERDPVLTRLNKIIDRIPVVPEKKFPTPFGIYKTPEFYVPKLQPPTLDSRQWEAFKAALLQDVSSLLNAIPALGALAEPLTDLVSDTAQAKIQDTLNQAENDFFKNYNKVDPLSTVAMIRTMVRTHKEL
jgi:hypothetical protein